MVIDLPDGYQQGANLVNTYDFHRTVAVAENSWAARDTVAINLPIGILRRVLVFFPPGCHNRVRANIYHGATQLLPTDPVGAGVGTYYLTGDNYWFDTRDFFEYIPAGAVAFTLNCWNIGAVTADVFFDHVVDFYFMIERVVVP